MSSVEHGGYVMADDGVTESVRVPISPGATVDASKCCLQTGVKRTKEDSMEIKGASAGVVMPD